MYEKEIIRREPQKRRERKKKDGKEKKKEGTEIWKKKTQRDRLVWKYWIIMGSADQRKGPVD